MGVGDALWFLSGMMTVGAVYVGGRLWRGWRIVTTEISRGRTRGDVRKPPVTSIGGSGRRSSLSSLRTFPAISSRTVGSP